MAENPGTELETFHRYIGLQLATGNGDSTPEECLRVWRCEHPTPGEMRESVAAVKRALEQAQRGEGKTLDDFDREFRARHAIAEEA